MTTPTQIPNNPPPSDTPIRDYLEIEANATIGEGKRFRDVEQFIDVRDMLLDLYCEDDAPLREPDKHGLNRRQMAIIGGLIGMTPKIYSKFELLLRRTNTYNNQSPEIPLQAHDHPDHEHYIPCTLEAVSAVSQALLKAEPLPSFDKLLDIEQREKLKKAPASEDLLQELLLQRGDDSLESLKQRGVSFREYLEEIATAYLAVDDDIGGFCRQLGITQRQYREFWNNGDQKFPVNLMDNIARAHGATADEYVGWRRYIMDIPGTVSQTSINKMVDELDMNAINDQRLLLQRKFLRELYKNEGLPDYKALINHIEHRFPEKFRDSGLNVNILSPDRREGYQEQRMTEVVHQSRRKVNLSRYLIPETAAELLAEYAFPDNSGTAEEVHRRRDKLTQFMSSGERLITAYVSSRTTGTMRS